MPKSPAQPTTERLALALQPETYSADAGTVDVVFYTGAAVKRYDFWTDTSYDLAFAADGADLSLLNAGAPFLDNHDSGSVRNVLGSILPGSARTEKDGTHRATIRLSDREEMKGVRQDIKDGHLRGISMGVEITSPREVTKREGKPDLHTALTWQPYELSSAPVQADPGAHVLSLLPAETRAHLIALNAAGAAKEDKMPDPPKTAPTTETTPADLDAVRLAAQTVERERIEAIQSQAERLGLTREDAAPMIRDGSNVDAARLALHELKVQRDEATRTTSTTGLRTETNTATLAKAAVDAILLRSGQKVDKPSDLSLRLSRQSLTGISRAVVGSTGADVGAMSDRQAVRHLFRMERDALHAAGGDIEHLMSTADLPFVYAAVTSKIAGPMYAEYATTYEPWQSRVDVPHPYNVSIVRTSGVSQMPVIVEGADATETSFGDEAETHAVAHRGRIISITEEMVMGDQIGVIAQRAAFLANSAATTRNTVAYAPLLANPVMFDGINFFNALHSNMAAGGDVAPPSQATLGVAIAAMMNQTITLPDGTTQRVQITPRYLLIPVSLMTTVEALMSQFYTPTASTGVITQRMRGLEVIADPILDASSVTAWYLIGEPAQANAFVWGYATSRQGYQTEMDERFESGALRIKGGIWYGATAVDFRGAYYNAG